MAQNSFKGKFHEGTFAGGQGPMKGLEISREAEEKGVLNPSDKKKNLGVVSGQNDGLMGKTEDRGFDLYSKPYAGPGNIAFKPDNKGVVNPDDINRG